MTHIQCLISKIISYLALPIENCNFLIIVMVFISTSIGHPVRVSLFFLYFLTFFSMCRINTKKSNIKSQVQFRLLSFLASRFFLLLGGRRAAPKKIQWVASRTPTTRKWGRHQNQHPSSHNLLFRK